MVRSAVTRVFLALMSGLLLTTASLAQDSIVAVAACNYRVDARFPAGVGSGNQIDAATEAVNECRNSGGSSTCCLVRALTEISEEDPRECISMFAIVHPDKEIVSRWVGYNGFTMDEAASQAKDACNALLAQEGSPETTLRGRGIMLGLMHQCEAVASGCRTVPNQGGDNGAEDSK